MLVIMLLCFLCACNSNDKSNEYGLFLIDETEHAQYFAAHNDDATQAVVSKLSNNFEEQYDRITQMFDYTAEKKIPIHIYTNKQQFQEVIDRETEGTYDATDGVIKVFTPTDLTNGDKLNEYKFQLVHEFVHAVIQQANSVVGQIKWLDEGVAYYASLQLEQDLVGMKSVSNPPTLEQLGDPTYFDQFGSEAYLYSGLIVKFIVNMYGIERLNEVLRNPLEIESILNRTLEQLYDEWVAQL